MGKALIFSAPSGSGKTTIVHHLLDKFPQLEFSISATTRKPRAYEKDGVDYYFLALEDFQSREFIEKEEVYPGVFYGTLSSEIERIWKKGKTVIFDVDVKGGVNLKKYFADQAMAVFVKVSDFDTLKTRLSDRGSESQKSLNTRLARIQYEMTFENQFEEVLLNDDLPIALNQVEKLVSQFLNS